MADTTLGGRAAVPLAIILLACASATAQEANSLARRLYDGAMKDVFRPGLAPKETGEGLCWRAAYSGHSFPDGFRAYGDEAFVQYGVKYYDALAAAMMDCPDGYKGFVGPYDYDARFWCDVHVGDSLVIGGMLALAEVIRGEPNLKAKYGPAADKYVAIAERDLFEKWDARDTWREDGPYGTYVFSTKYLRPKDANQWVTPPNVRNTGISLPYNQQNDVAVACLRLFRLTGKEKYRDRAARLFAFMKSRFQLLDDHYCWNYWEPFGPWDFDLAKGEPRHWIGTHPYRNYQAGEIGQIVEAYHAGVVFDETDIRRLLNTNLKVMWNGSLQEPNFRNSIVTATGYRPPSPSKDYPTWAGCLWSGLADFDATIRQLAAKEYRPSDDPGDQINAAYFRAVTCKEPPSFARKHASGAPAVFDFPFSECKGLVAAGVLPSRIKRGEKAVVFCQSLASGELEVALYSADGKTKKAVLFSQSVKGGADGGTGLTLRQWDGSDPAGKEPLEGPYRIRWTFLEGYREFPVVISK